MRSRIVKTIFLKEIRETLRDRRTMIIMLFLPVVMYPALLVIFSQIMNYSQVKFQKKDYKVVILGEAPEAMVNTIEEDQQLKVVTVPIVKSQLPESLKITREKPKEEEHKPDSFYTETINYDDSLKDFALEKIKEAGADVAIILPQDFKQLVESEQTGKALVLYDETKEGVHVVVPRLSDALRQYRNRERERRFKSTNNEGIYRPLAWREEGIATAEKKGGNFAGRIIPLLLMMMVMLGAFYPAVDLTAGEKERGTMQTLLTAPALPIEIIFGKFFTVFVVAMISALSNLGSMILAIIFVIESNEATQDLNLQFPPSTGVVLFLQLIPVAIIFSAMMLAVASFAKSFKEAQNYLTPVYLIVIIPIIISALPGFELTTFTALIPILNITLLMKEMLVETPDINLIITVMVANLVYSIMTLLLAVKIFKSEMVLLGGQGAVSDAFSIKKKGKPNCAVSVGFFAAIFVLYFYGSLACNMIFKKFLDAGQSTLATVVCAQVLFLALPCFVFIKWQKYNIKEVLSLRAPKVLDIIAVIIMGLTSWFVLSLIPSAIQKPIFDALHLTNDMASPSAGLFESAVPMILIVSVLALTPGICEELVFRGVIMSGFRESTTKWKAIILTSILFGLMHQHISVIFPTAFIGFFVTVIVWYSRSLFLGILFHAMHNGVGAFLQLKNTRSENGKLLEGLFKEEFSQLDIGQVLIAFLTFGIGLGLFIYSHRRNKSTDMSQSDNNQESAIN